MKRKDLFGFTVLEDLVHGWLALLTVGLWWGSTSRWGTHGGASCSLPGSQGIKETEQKKEGLRSHNPSQGTPPKWRTQVADGRRPQFLTTWTSLKAACVSLWHGSSHGEHYKRQSERERVREREGRRICKVIFGPGSHILWVLLHSIC